LWLGELNQDEGVYLYAAREVVRGRLPFVDFASTQGPMMSLVYAMAWPLVERWGLAGGRLFTLCLGLTAVALSGWIAARIAGHRRGHIAAFIACVLVGVNVYQSYFTVIVKTYALTAFFLTAGFLLLSFRKARRGWLGLLGAGVFLALAGATRLSAMAALPAVGAWLFWRTRSGQAGGGRVAVCRSSGLFFFSAGAGLTLLAVFLPFVARAPRVLSFGLIEYHAARKVDGILPLLAYKAGFISRFVQAYFVAAGLLFFHCLRILKCRRQTAGWHNDASEPASGDDQLSGVVWGAVVLTSAVHFLAPFPYDDYQVIVFPLIGAALAGGVASWDLRTGIPACPVGNSGIKGRNVACLGLLVLCAMAAFSSPLNQSWFIGRRDRIWWPLKTGWPLADLKRAANLVRAHCGVGDLLLTQDLYLAVEADRTVPVGLELGPFSCFPDWSRERAEKCHVVNCAMLQEILEKTRAPVAAFSEWSLAIASPQVVPLKREEQARLRAIVERRYRLLGEIDRFGQAETRLEVRVLSE
ncbi:MAG: hypothetical protein N2255_02220, partial [Kiritimatiellae bacterium]|nr:hypothetical protein [Kiritimatiellia bacterium]